jgi:L-threonylcarbamoyladenylate synthase
MDAGRTDRIDAAADAIERGELVVYPTETVYGLAADPLEPATVERVFAAKGRDRDDPISLAVPTPEAATAYVDPPDRGRAFMEAFLPGPVTVVVEKRSVVPDVLTAGRERVGVRVPDHDLAQALLEAAAPLTATSANVSGRGSATTVDAVDPEIREAAAVVLDGGETGGTGSTVVDVERDELHREGAGAEAVAEWLATHD